MSDTLSRLREALQAEFTIYIGRISPRPLLMINGTQDQDYFRAVSVEPLFRLARQPRRIVWAETGHQLPTAEHQALLVEWLREQLR